MTREGAVLEELLCPCTVRFNYWLSRATVRITAPGGVKPDHLI